ncbi:unnamed protein product [Gulo gulo]|uniref:Uncharacterized protein n=1 Tax=Gulo gulo TaxID=48420 RepID=A0A9X9M4R9_GULGU|nr:unnamed protein product [Gulo gulo]
MWRARWAGRPLKGCSAGCEANGSREPPAPCCSQGRLAPATAIAWGTRSWR